MFVRTILTARLCPFARLSVLEFFVPLCLARIRRNSQQHLRESVRCCGSRHTGFSRASQSPSMSQPKVKKLLTETVYRQGVTVCISGQIFVQRNPLKRVLGLGGPLVNVTKWCLGQTGIRLSGECMYYPLEKGQHRGPRRYEPGVSCFFGGSGRTTPQPHALAALAQRRLMMNRISGII
ncbi:hypothetical protein QBC35DRAFT_180455 [Podospora australis]|uniref:Uncharacterized protein n=1 Tax=Podospora australis TaxID=1536484 RepID=A0AAN6WX42_9PEZI|nr:hypothetical protein QBC35DRAFT_180455 [Podospora australis]